VKGPGWVDPLPPPPHTKPPRVVLIPDVLALFTPCHGARLFFPDDQARPGARFEARCDDCGARLAVELIADSSQEFGLRAEWNDRPKKGGGR